MSYWVIKRGDEYPQANSGAFRPNRESAVRFFEIPTHLAEDERRVYVRTRPSSERMYMAERVRELENELRGTKAKLYSAEYQLEKARARLAAWEPTIRAVRRVIERWPEGNVEAVWEAGDAIPEEHRP